MKKGLILVMNKRYDGNTAIENVLNYVLSSPFADYENIMSANLKIENFDSILREFHEVQQPYNIENHRRLMHFVITTSANKFMEQDTINAALMLLDYFDRLGHQVLAVPHFGSKSNVLNYHIHAIVNIKSFSSGKTLLDKYSTYNDIRDYLNQNPYVHWTWKYSNDQRVILEECL